MAIPTSPDKGKQREEKKPLKRMEEVVSKKSGFEPSSDGVTIVAQKVRSSNYVPNTSGWMIDSNGEADLNAVSVNMNGGTINMDGGSITNVDFVSGADGGIDFNQGGRIEISNHFDPPDGGSKNLGGADRYWGDISYKTLTDRGCLGWYDDGVEMRDGRILTDLEALMEIKRHPTLKTPAGAPRLDYTTLPKHVYVPPRRHDGTAFPVDSRTGVPYSTARDRVTGVERRVPVQEGAETTALISILLGAIKELKVKNDSLEARVVILESKIV